MIERHSSAMTAHPQKGTLENQLKDFEADSAIDATQVGGDFGIHEG
jgi:hypothetical protein